VTLVARHVLCFGHITANSEHLPTEFFNHPGRFLVALVGHVGNNHAGGLTLKTPAPQPRPMPLPAPGHEGNLACEAPI
jgi:hypothetical protein